MEKCSNCVRKFCRRTGRCEMVEQGEELRNTKPGKSLRPIYSSKNKSKVSAKKKEEVFQRDGHKCVICDKTTDLTIDHIIPRVNGGTNEIPNLQTMCWICNHIKGRKHISNEKLKKLVMKLNNQNNG